MKMKMETIHIAGQRFILHPYGAAFWTERKMLLVSDLHLGKAGHFRKHGIGIPQTGITKDYERLDELCEEFCPETICFLGDLFHSEINKEFDLFTEWACACASQIILVAGNHDVIDHENYDRLEIKVTDDMLLDGIYMTHKPVDSVHINFAGHIHPGISLRGVGRMRVKVPCFYWDGKRLLFPAFGDLTGSVGIRPKKGHTVYALVDDEVIKME